MMFRMQHLFFDIFIEFSEKEIPPVLLTETFKWFTDSKVLTLDIGESVETDFQRITRIE